MARQTDTRERLLKAAAELVWKNSYHATGVDAICQSAGVQKGCFYHHFESKEALTLAALDMIWQNYKRFMDECFSPANKPVDRFVKFVAGGVASQKAAQKEYGMVRGCPIFGLGSEVGAQDDNIRRHVDDILETMSKYFASAIREGQTEGTMAPGDARQLAAMVLSLNEGAMTFARIQNDLAPLQALEDGIFRLLGIAGKRQRAAA
jgi:TetR/AcrR family transcriptional regulator, transcriptional repressor for nem operon